MYSKSKEGKLSRELFFAPTNEYRGAPFWAWNHALDRETLLRHIDYLKEMGMGGFHMHSRTGLDTEYLGKEFMDCVRACVDKAKKEGMYACLYDEDRWPSGAAGGKVTKDKRFRSRYLVLTPWANEDRPERDVGDDSFRRGLALGNGTLLERFDITLENNCLKKYRRLKEGEIGTNVWYLYEELTKEGPWYNNQTYIDTLNPEALQCFLEETHEKYLACVGDEFGKTVPSIFTDEPQFVNFTTLAFAQSRQDVILPYTDALPELYAAAYGKDLFDTIPELVWELPDGHPSAARYRYHDLVTECFSAAFADTLGQWCREHHIMLTGHMFGEETLHTQSSCLGEAMRSLRSFQLPGIDMLCDAREYGTAKQAQSVSHQYGCPGVMSELYGVTGWDFDFRSHKLAGDWQAALGVTLRVHHLAWDSMNGEAKRDYPASIFYQSPWYREYGLIENHFARLNTALTRGKPVVRIGVIHPVETYWLHFGPAEQTALIREELEECYKNTITWLLFSQLDFDFVSEGLLAGQYEKSTDGKLHVGKMAYDVILVPGCETLRSSTISCLEDFLAGGGDVLCMGDAPLYQDAFSSDAGVKLCEKGRRIGFSKSALITALEPYREVELRDASGRISDCLIYQLREENPGSTHCLSGGNAEDQKCRWLFVANGKAMKNPDIPKKERITFRIRGNWIAEEYDTMTGAIYPIPVSCHNNITELVHNMYDQTSVLLRLCPATDAVNPSAENRRPIHGEASRLSPPASFRLSEPNVLLLDQAAYRIYAFGQEPGEWQPSDDILRADDACRKIAGFPGRSSYAQPWTRQKRPAAHTLELRFTIHSEIEISDTMLALEEADKTQVFLNGTLVPAFSAAAGNTETGYFVDECIRTLPLPVIPAGISELIVKLPYAEDTSAEWCYLLGSFGVKIFGNKAVITRMPDHISYGDYCTQGFPFYAGNITYEAVFTAEETGEYILAAEKFRAPLLKVSVDGQEAGVIAFAPYQVSLGRLEKGTHLIALTSYGNRANAFGPVHSCDEQLVYIDPTAWRTTGAGYSYEYQLKRMGILTAPGIYRV